MPTPVPLHELVRVAGRRWSVEESFQTSKALAGLDEHQVRLWHSWKRWVTLAMPAHAFLTVTAARERIQHVTPRRVDPDHLPRHPAPVHHANPTTGP
ncbi:hypothetical protein [Streptomyces sp. NWU339]|uniref:hypothetical protein n=1 Tax=Streptomyces sp. NWU339 TaxID=2185284 RepID=UPI0015E7EEE8